MSDAFSKEYFLGLINDENAQKKSAKAFLATKQTVPGLGNGVLQDILYHAHIHPKKKIAALTDKEKENLFYPLNPQLSNTGLLSGSGCPSLCVIEDSLPDFPVKIRFGI